MDSGAYGSYPRNRSRRTFKKSLGRKRSRYSGYRANPINQFTYKKTRIGRLTKTNMQQLKATYNSTVYLIANTVNYTVLATGTQYVNLAAILAGSPEFVSRTTQYSYYMISGMSVTFTRRWVDPIALGVTGVSSGFLNLDAGLSQLSCNFYPNLINTAVGQPVEDADSSWKVSPFIHGNQTHYQPFPKNFTTGGNSNGLGVWNACSQYANIFGELAFYNTVGLRPSNIDDMQIWDIEVNVYCSFCNNTGA